MKILTRDDTDHNTEYVTREEAEAEIEVWRERALTKLTFEILSCMWCGELVEAPPGFEPGSALTPEGRKIAFQGHTLKCAMHPIRPLIDASRAVVERWDTPLWKDVPATAGYINRLRAVLDSQNVQEHATPLAGAGVETGVKVHVTGDVADSAASGGCCVSSCSESSIDSRQAEIVMKQYMESLVELIKPGLAQEVIPGDIQMARNRTIELFECPLGEVTTPWAAETPDNINLGRFQRSIPLLVLLWRLRHGLNDGHHGLNSGLWVSGALHGITKEVDHPEVVEFWNHIIFLPNAEPMRGENETNLKGN